MIGFLSARCSHLNFPLLALMNFQKGRVLLVSSQKINKFISGFVVGGGFHYTNGVFTTTTSIRDFIARLARFGYFGASRFARLVIRSTLIKYERAAAEGAIQRCWPHCWVGYAPSSSAHVLRNVGDKAIGQDSENRSRYVWTKQLTRIWMIEDECPSQCNITTGERSPGQHGPGPCESHPIIQRLHGVLLQG